MNILLSAFACEPNKGSEPGVGWNWAVNLAKSHNVAVITRGQSKNNIESFFEENSKDNIAFFYYEDTGIWKFIDEKVPFGYQIYYKHWQKKIVPMAEKIMKQYKTQIIHHITYNEFRTTGKLYNLGVPFVWGPLGGGHSYRKELKNAYYRKTDIILERIRKCLNSYFLETKDFKNVIKSAACILVADPETYKLMPKCREYVRLLETAYYPERNPIKTYNYEENRPKIKLMYAGALIPRKGLKILVDALGESDFRDFELIIIGNGQDYGKIKENVNRYGLSSQIKFIGKLTYSEVNQYYDQTDLFLFPSMRDTSGNVVLEAMSHGVPVIALNINGVSEMINNDCGDLIPIQTYDQVKKDIINTILKYHRNMQLIEEKGLNARRRIEIKFNWDNVMKTINEIYSELVTDNHVLE